MNISFIIPGRNNLKYLKWAYDSICKNKKNHNVQICFADDNSNDGTWEWCESIMKSDKNFNAIRNDSGKRLGHTILYDRLINEVAKNDICIIWHCDMYLAPGALDAIERNISEKTIVSLTRIEPPLHPSGPEKIIYNFGTEPEDFNEENFIEFLGNGDLQDLVVEKFKAIPSDLQYPNYCTKGIFAPWAFYKKDFNDIYGHDPLYAPQSKEDSDIFNKFKLNGITFRQTWEGFTYHMTCRGSRFNPTLTKVGINSDEWEAQNIKSTRNFIRKWGQLIKHDVFLNPIVSNKYNIGIIFNNMPKDMLPIIRTFEPWCTNLYLASEFSNDSISTYINEEQQNTLYDLSKRIKSIQPNDALDLFESCPNDIMILIDAHILLQDRQYIDIIFNMSDIISESGQLGEMEFNLMKINIKSLTDYKYELLKENNNINNKR